MHTKSQVSAEQRVFSLVLALVASSRGLTRTELLSSVYGYADRYRADGTDSHVERMFERDKDQLRRLGIPLETVDSPNAAGDNRLTRYRISKARLQLPSDLSFSVAELRLLKLASLVWSEDSLGEQSRWVTMKLAAMGADLDLKHLGIVPRVSIPEPAAPALHRAITERKVVNFDYQLATEAQPMRRTVAPLRLHRAERRWHLIGYDVERESDRVFLLSRVCSEVRVLRRHFDAALFEHVDGVLEQLLQRADVQRVQVMVARGSAAEARLEYLGQRSCDAEAHTAHAAEAAAGESAEHSRMIEFGTLDLHELAVELAGYGDEVAVLSPVGLRDDVITRLRQVREQHSVDFTDAEAGVHTPGTHHVPPGESLMSETSPPTRSQRHQAAGTARRLATTDRVMLLLALVPYLREHGATPIAKLAKTFHIDTHELRRIVEFLGTAGVPGDTGTYQHEDLFDIDWDALEQHDLVTLTHTVAIEETPRFSVKEIVTLIAGLHALEPMLPETLRAPVPGIVQKLSGLTHPPESGAAGKKVSREEVAAVPVAISEDAGEARLAVLTAAMNDGVQLQFSYRDARGIVGVRTVEPLLLGQSGGSWYLRAYCQTRQAERTFLLDRMRDPRPLAARAEHRPSTVAPHTSLIDVSAANVTAKVRVFRGARHRIAHFTPRLIDAAAPFGSESGESGVDWMRVAVDLLHSAVAVRIVQASPGQIVIDSPVDARDLVREWADRALAHYDA